MKIFINHNRPFLIHHSAQLQLTQALEHEASDTAFSDMVYHYAPMELSQIIIIFCVCVG